MKKKYYICLFSCLFLAISCNIIEDVEDLSKYTPDGVWEDENLASAYLTDLYDGAFDNDDDDLHGAIGWPTNGNLADETLGILGENHVQTTNDEFKYWPYDQIRDINVMIEGLKSSKLSDELKNPLLGQAYFIRAWHYFKMLRMHGGVPVILVVQKMTDDLKVKRNTSLECFDAIIADLDEAFKLITELKNDPKTYGRINKSTVAAFKGRVLIHKASPQFNPSSPYNNSYIEEAYTATKSAVELLKENGYGLVSSYSDIFDTEGHNEAVLPVVYTETQRENGRLEHGVRPLSETSGATGYDQPIWNLVEAFPMKDGKRIGESSLYSYDLQSYWENRDPRFYSTIAYNACVFELSGKLGRRQYTTVNIASHLDAFGLGIQGEWHHRTGLYCRKGLEEELTVESVQLNDVDWLEIRFAEVLFNYAEMANENGEQEVAYDVLKQIRERAGIDVGDGLYGLKAGMTKEEMRMALLDEKRIEFCFEGQRFWDLRRHRMLHTHLHGIKKYGVLAEYDNPDGSTTVTTEAKDKATKYELLPEDFIYSIKDVARYFDQNAQNQMYTPETYYFFPIHKDEIDKNPNLEQNEGWGGSFKGELP